MQQESSKYCLNPNHFEEEIVLICGDPQFQNTRLSCIRCATEEYTDYSPSMLNISDILRDKIPKNWPLDPGAKELFEKKKKLQVQLGVNEYSEDTKKLKNEVNTHIDTLQSLVDSSIQGVIAEVEKLFKESQNISRVIELTQKINEKMSKAYNTTKLKESLMNYYNGDINRLEVDQYINVYFEDEDRIKENSEIEQLYDEMQKCEDNNLIFEVVAFDNFVKDIANKFEGNDSQIARNLLDPNYKLIQSNQKIIVKEQSKQIENKQANFQITEKIQPFENSQKVIPKISQTYVPSQSYQNVQDQGYQQQSTGTSYYPNFGNDVEYYSSASKESQQQASQLQYQSHVVQQPQQQYQSQINQQLPQQNDSKIPQHQQYQSQINQQQPLQNQSIFPQQQIQQPQQNTNIYQSQFQQQQQQQTGLSQSQNQFQSFLPQQSVFQSQIPVSFGQQQQQQQQQQQDLSQSYIQDKVKKVEDFKKFSANLPQTPQILKQQQLFPLEVQASIISYRILNITTQQAVSLCKRGGFKDQISEKLLIISTTNAIIYAYDFVTGFKLFSFKEGQNHKVNAACLVPIDYNDLSSLKEQNKLYKEKSNCPEGIYITGSQTGGNIYIWDVLNTKQLKKYNIEISSNVSIDIIDYIQNPYYSAKVKSSGIFKSSKPSNQPLNYLVIAFSNQTIKILNWLTGTTERVFNVKYAIETLTKIEDDTGTRDEIIATAGQSQTISLWNQKSKKDQPEIIVSSFKAVSALKFFFKEVSLSGEAYIRSRMLAVGEFSIQRNQAGTAKIEIWDLYNKSLVGLFDSGHPLKINSISHIFTTGLQNLLVTSGDDDVYLKVWSAEKGFMASVEPLSQPLVKNGLTSQFYRQLNQNGRYEIICVQKGYGDKYPPELIIYDVVQT